MASAEQGRLRHTRTQTRATAATGGHTAAGAGGNTASCTSAGQMCNGSWVSQTAGETQKCQQQGQQQPLCRKLSGSGSQVDTQAAAGPAWQKAPDACAEAAAKTAQRASARLPAPRSNRFAQRQLAAAQAAAAGGETSGSSAAGHTVRPQSAKRGRESPAAEPAAEPSDRPADEAGSKRRRAAESATAPRSAAASAASGNRLVLDHIQQIPSEHLK